MGCRGYFGHYFHVFGPSRRLVAVRLSVTPQYWPAVAHSAIYFIYFFVERQGSGSAHGLYSIGVQRAEGRA